MRRLARVLVSGTYRLVDLLSGSSTPADDDLYLDLYTDDY